MEEHPVSLDCMRHIHSQTPTYAADPLGSRFSDDEHDVDPVCSSLLEVCINEEEPEDSMSHLYGQLLLISLTGSFENVAFSRRF